MSAEFLSSIVVARGAGLDEQRSLVAPSTRRAAELACGASLGTSTDGSVTATFATRGDVLEHGERAAHCALTLRALLPSAIVVIATRRGAEFAPAEMLSTRADVLFAQRLGAESLSGIRIDDETAACLGSRFELTVESDSLRLAGERDDDSDAAPTLIGRPTAFVGRERELRTLSSAFDECVNDRVVRVVVITGPPGSGKSRLLNECVREIARGEVPTEIWRARADASRLASPCALISTLLARSAGMPDNAPAEALNRIRRARIARHVPAEQIETVAAGYSSMLALATDAATPPLDRNRAIVMREAIKLACRHFVAAECASRPLAIVLDDLQWSDRASIRMFDELLDGLRAHPLLLIAAARPEIAQRFPRLWYRHRAQSVKLGELASNSCELLVRNAFSASAGKPDLASIAARSSGNAFALEELTRAAHARRSIPVGSVSDIARARFRSLDIGEQRTLAAASVFGCVFWSGGVDALRGGESQTRAIDAMVENELVQFRGTSEHRGVSEFAFRDTPIRDAAYETLAEHERRELHATAADWLHSMGERDAAVFALHYAAGGNRERAAQYYRAAAVRACDHGDFATATELAGKAIAAGAAGSDREALEAVANLCREPIREPGAP